MKRMKAHLSVVILWGVVAYAIALLTYCTMNNFSNSTADDISAFGSLLGACGAFFAAFVATFLFNDWREIHNQTTFKDICTSIFNTQTKLNVKLVSINDSFSKAREKCSIDQNEYDTLKIAEIIEKDIQQIGDLITELLYQILYLRKLSIDFDKPIVDEMNDLLLDYMTLMDITTYKKMQNHTLFLRQESELKKRWDNLESKFLDLLANQTILKL